MRTKLFLIIIMLIPFAGYSKDFTFLGDSRAAMLGGLTFPIPLFQQNDELPKLYIKDVTWVDGSPEKVLKGDDIIFKKKALSMSMSGLWVQWTNDYKANISKGGLPYRSDVSLISLGGNDYLVPAMIGVPQHLSKMISQDILKYISHLPYEEAEITRYLVYCIYSWYAETTADIAVANTGYLMKFILDCDPNNKIILNDIAPVLMMDPMVVNLEANTPRKLDVEFTCIMNHMVDVLNMKYRDELMPSLKSIYGDRVQHLKTFTFFMTAIQLWDIQHYWPFIYYSLVDGVHFTFLGNMTWGRMVAKKIGALGWFNRADSICNSDSTPPTFNLPSSGCIPGIGMFGILNTPLPLDFIIKDNGRVMDVENAEQLLGDSYRIYLNNNMPAGKEMELDIVARDTCGNPSGYKIRYWMAITGMWRAVWGFYSYLLFYTCTPI
ncbi:MAG: hypothetical protein MUD12_06800 [Spirochaetes bacterium]|nr:hypothetical protein [Spirochaetota bacterium]